MEFIKNKNDYKKALYLRIGGNVSTYGDHVELGNAVLFDRERERDAVLFDEHF